VGTVVATDSWETNEGTRVRVTLDYDDEWTIGETNNVRITFELYELGGDVRDVHDITLSVKVVFPDKTYEDSAGTWSLDTEGDDISYRFQFEVDERDVDEGDKGTVYYAAEWREDIAWQTDPYYDTDWQSYGSVTAKPSGFAKVQIIDTDYPHSVEENEKFTLEVTLQNIGNLDATNVKISINFDETCLECTSDKQRTVGTIGGGETKTISWHFTAEQLSFGSSGETVTISISFTSSNAGSGTSQANVTIEPAGITGGQCLGTLIITIVSFIALAALGLKRKQP